MEGLQSLQIGFVEFIENPHLILLLSFGVLFGLILGAIPGLTGTLGITILLPFTYVMSAGEGLTTLIGIYVGGITGGLIAACLLNIPGSPASVVTCFDGAPMARGGRSSDALTLGMFASLIGGVLAAVALIVIAPIMARVALMFGAWEYFGLGIMGLSVVISLCSKNKIKGFIAAVLGIVFSIVGMDPITAVGRYTFGTWQLGSGLNVMAVLIGLFALAEILNQVKSLRAKGNLIKAGGVRFIPPKGIFSGYPAWRTMSISAGIGIVIGILPGVGQTTSSLIAYTTARQTSKYPEKFGTGIEEGILASEAANNACNGGAMVPMMTLGIPGDLITALLLGGLIMHGLQPGPMLFIANKDVVGTIFVAFLLANVVMYIFGMGLMPMFIKLLTVPMNILFPFILVMCVVGTIAVNNRTFDTWIFLIIGTIGFLAITNGFPLPPIILGYILGPIIEINFRTAVVSSVGDLSLIFTKPIAMGLIIFGIAMVAVPILMERQRAKKNIGNQQPLSH